MKQQLKHFLLTALVALCSITAFAHDFEMDGIYYNYNGDGTSVSVTYRGDDYSSYPDRYKGAVTIPSSVTYNGKTYSVTSIRYDAFYGCRGLTSVNIPNSVTSIGRSAFCYCSGLTSVTIPNSVTSIGESAFDGTALYKDEGNWDKGALYIDGCLIIAKSSINGSFSIKDGTRVIGESAFSDCRGLTSVTIPNSVESIGDYAFSHCSGLTSVTIPNSVTSIGESAFFWCSGLTSPIYNTTVFAYMPSKATGHYSIPEGIKTIAGDAFCRCSGLTSVTIPNSVTSIGDYAFAYCSGLTSVTIPNSVESIGSSAFSNCSGLTSVTIGNSVESIGDNAFRDCNGLTRIIILSSTVNIERYAFYCNPVPTGRVTYIPNSSITANDMGTKIVYPSQIFTVDDFTYMITDVSAKTCSMISYDGEDTDVTVPATVLYNGRIELTVTGVRQSAFAYNRKVQSITFNNSGSIGYYACYDCSALQSVSIGNSVKSVETIFYGCSALTSLTIGSGVTSIGSLAGTTSLSRVDVAEENETYCDINGVICSKDGTRILVAPKGIKSYTIPNSVTSIADYAFQDCTVLTSIDIPCNITSIGECAFYDCTNMTTANVNATGSISSSAFRNATNLTSLTIGNNVTSISNYAFTGASKLTSLTIGNNVTSISNYAFTGASKLTELRIPHSVTAIGESAFSGCSALETLYLGEHLKTIGWQAFLNCTKLATITSTNVTPPSCYSEAFSGVDGTLCEVNVREEALEAYQQAYCWKNFWFLQGYAINYIEKQPTSDDVSVVMHNTKEDVTYQWYSRWVEIKGSGSYPWKELSNGSWMSTNNGVNNSTSSMVIENLTVKSGDKLTFDYTVSSESGYDKLSVYWNGNAILSNISGNTSASFSYTFTADKTATLEFCYSKDGSNSSGSDCATISNVKINGIGQWKAIPGATDAKLDISTLSNINRVYCVVTLSDGIQLNSDVVEVSADKTGIEMTDATNRHDDKIYDLQGRRVDSPKQHGLYIVGGKKLLKR